MQGVMLRSLTTLILRTNTAFARKKPIICNKIIKSTAVLSTQRFYSNVVDESEQIVQELCHGDPELEKRLRLLMLEVEVKRQDGHMAPERMQSRHWQQLLELKSMSQRTKYLTYLFKVEKAKENKEAKKQEKRKEKESIPREIIKENADDQVYGIQNQTMFLRIYPSSMDRFYNYRALLASLYGQKIVIDCSYEKYMVHYEVTNAAKQLTYVFGDNRVHKDPFDIHLCNLDLSGKMMKQLKMNIPVITEPWFPMNLHTKSYLDIFPRDQLVYLTPHCREELTEFDPNAIYIVGCMVDKFNNEPLSLAKAKRDNIKMAKLPLDRYLEWAPGSRKNLNINHMVPILLDLKLTGDWEFALQHIPRRKLMETKIKAMEKKLRNPNLSRDVIMSMSHLPGFKKEYAKVKGRKSLLYDDDD